MFKKILIFILGLSLGVLLSISVYMYTLGDVEWNVYIKEKLMPCAVLALSAVTAFCVAATPMVNKINGTLSTFDNATAKVNKTASNGDTMSVKVDLALEKMEAIAEKVEGYQTNILAAVDKVEKTTKNTEEMTRIGFCNQKELVEGGYAAAIAKVGADNGNEGKEA